MSWPCPASCRMGVFAVAWLMTVFAAPAVMTFRPGTFQFSAEDTLKVPGGKMTGSPVEEKFDTAAAMASVLSLSPVGSAPPLKLAFITLPLPPSASSSSAVLFMSPGGFGSPTSLSGSTGVNG